MAVGRIGRIGGSVWRADGGESGRNLGVSASRGRRGGWRRGRERHAARRVVTVWRVGVAGMFGAQAGPVARAAGVSSGRVAYCTRTATMARGSSNNAPNWVGFLPVFVDRRTYRVVVVVVVAGAEAAVVTAAITGGVSAARIAGGG